MPLQLLIKKPLTLILKIKITFVNILEFMTKNISFIFNNNCRNIVPQLLPMLNLILKNVLIININYF